MNDRRLQKPLHSHNIINYYDDRRPNGRQISEKSNVVQDILCDTLLRLWGVGVKTV